MRHDCRGQRTNNNDPRMDASTSGSFDFWPMSCYHIYEQHNPDLITGYLGDMKTTGIGMLAPRCSPVKNDHRLKQRWSFNLSATSALAFREGYCLLYGPDRRMVVTTRADRF